MKHTAKKLEKFLGRKYAPDPLDMRYAMSMVGVFARLDTLRRFMPWRWGRIYNQGGLDKCPGEHGLGSCVGQSVSAALRAAPYMREDVTPCEIYRGAQEHDEWPGTDYEGSSVRGGLKYAKLKGYITSYHKLTSISAVEAWLSSRRGGPVVAGSDWYTGMFYPDKKGYIEPTGSVEGGHAYALRWVSPASGDFLVPNSWGTEWGQKGYCRIRKSTLDYLLFGTNGEAFGFLER